MTGSSLTTFRLLVIVAAVAVLTGRAMFSSSIHSGSLRAPVHVPALIAQGSGLPQTLNGRYSEKAAREVVNGRRPANISALKNPETLKEIADHQLLRR
jgi:hypothetical protein